MKGVSATFVAVAVVLVIIFAGLGGFVLYQGNGRPASSSTIASSLTSAFSTATPVATPGTSTSSTSTAIFTSSASIGVTSTPTTTSLETSTSSTTLQTQADLAQKECASLQVCLTVSSGLGGIGGAVWSTKVAPAFYAQYPWATGKINFANVTQGEAASMAIYDYKAGNVHSDIIWGGMSFIYRVFPAGAVQNYASPMAQQLNYTKDAYDPNGAWTVVSVNVQVLVYNPNAMAARHLPIPSSWSDLANPVYKGQIEIEPPANLTGSAQIFYYLYTRMGNSTGQWTQLMKSIAANNPVLSNTQDVDIPSGKYALGITSFQNYLRPYAKDPNSIAYRALSPSIYNPVVIALLKSGPHPEMAKLMEDWMLSLDGQRAIAAVPVVPYQTSVSAAYGLNPIGAVLLNGLSDPTFLQNANAWSDTFRNIFGG